MKPYASSSKSPTKPTSFKRRDKFSINPAAKDIEKVIDSEKPQEEDAEEPTEAIKVEESKSKWNFTASELIIKKREEILKSFAYKNLRSR
jgi:hypothetical protein